MPKDECAEAHEKGVDVAIACCAHIEGCTGNESVEQEINWCGHGLPLLCYIVGLTIVRG